MIGRPMVVRRRPLLRAAAIGGTFAAGRAAGGRADERADAEASQDERINALEANQVPAQPSAEQYTEAPDQQGSQTAASPVLDQLSQLTAMHDQGALTDEEFAAAKARVLGG
jgi:putative oligomerization/nucleic acid binding protein